MTSKGRNTLTLKVAATRVCRKPSVKPELVHSLKLRQIALYADTSCLHVLQKSL